MNRARQALRYATGADLVARLLRLHPARAATGERSASGSWRQLPPPQRYAIARRCAWRFHGYAAATIACTLFTVSALVSRAWLGVVICATGAVLCMSQMVKYSIVAYQYRRGEATTVKEWWQRAAIPKIHDSEHWNE